MILSYYDIAKCREDITEYVYHFTQGANAFDILQKILEEGCIRDMQEREDKDYRICFTEAPLRMLPKMFKKLEEENGPRYAPYGTGIKKEILYFHGARPVIYGDCHDCNLLPKELKWRFVSYYPGKYDYSWQREWRLPKKEFCINPQNCIVIVKTKEEGQILFEPSDIIMDGDIDDGEYHCHPLVKTVRRFKGISLDVVEELNDEKEVEATIKQQRLGEDEFFNIGQYL